MPYPRHPDLYRDRGSAAPDVLSLRELPADEGLGTARGHALCIRWLRGHGCRGHLGLIILVRPTSLCMYKLARHSIQNAG